MPIHRPLPGIPPHSGEVMVYVQVCPSFRSACSAPAPDSPAHVRLQRCGGHRCASGGDHVSRDADTVLTEAFAEAQSAAKILVSFSPDCFLNSVGIANLLDQILPSC